MREKNKFRKLWKVICMKSYMHASHPADLEEWIKSRRYEIQEFFEKRIFKFRNVGNRDYHTCPYRMGDLEPWERKENLDRWNKRNKDKVCSFCGSWHPEEFLAFLDKVISTKAEENRIEISDKKYKIYVTRPGILNAGEGTIKFKTHHLSKEQYQNNYLKINEAHKLSWNKFMAKMDIKFNVLGDNFE